ncbi:MAG: glycosyltransferase [Prevotellaceae bacterium]|nr:glycosyltransferase [Prevotellaceae bacterium]
MDAKNCKIFVTVGSRNYQFNRLFVKLDELYEQGVLQCEMFAQTGTSTYVPKHYQWKNFVSQEEFLEKIEWADLVVSHGASGSIMKALNAGKKVLAVTRLEKYNEHINDHQIQNNEAFASNGYVLAVYEMEDLGKTFKKFFDGEDGTRPWVNKDPLAIVKLIDNNIQNWDSNSSDTI